MTAAVDELINDKKTKVLRREQEKIMSNAKSEWEADWNKRKDASAAAAFDEGVNSVLSSKGVGNERGA